MKSVTLRLIAERLKGGGCVLASPLLGEPVPHWREDLGVGCFLTKNVTGYEFNVMSSLK